MSPLAVKTPNRYEKEKRIAFLEQKMEENEQNKQTIVELTSLLEEKN